MVTPYNQKKGKPGPKINEIDWYEAKRMRDRYKRIKEIAAHYGVSEQIISQGFKARGIK